LMCFLFCLRPVQFYWPRPGYRTGP
jgi:hypothetical protein